MCRWAITGDDPEFKGKGNPDTGDDYGPAPGQNLWRILWLHWNHC